MVHEGSWACCGCGVGDQARGYRDSDHGFRVTEQFVIVNTYKGVLLALINSFISPHVENYLNCIAFLHFKRSLSSTAYPAHTCISTSKTQQHLTCLRSPRRMHQQHLHPRSINPSPSSSLFHSPFLIVSCVPSLQVPQTPVRARVRASMHNSPFCNTTSQPWGLHHLLPSPKTSRQLLLS